ncbi:MAG: type II toxin-antitoxin system RelE/ParE family toxin [Oscillospiraceae bacterium]|jgi:plasmid stabilization system protein ParE|nr:type II toxin-antitoxin system RelE/ParE family toxin [Oscillospiraceae bacterium]
MSIVKWTQTALDDLANIQEYIARDSVYYANKFVDDAFKAVGRLEIFPESGRIVPERSNPNFREVIFGSYRIMYKLIDNDCYITTMIHGRRDYMQYEVDSEDI